jgi:uncharacterized protein VcgC/VcgE DUF2780
MARVRLLVIVCLALAAVVATSRLAYAKQVDPKAAAAAVKASPDLVKSLSTELGSTPEQAAGAAGSLFSLAKSRLKPDEFSQVAKAVPGMDSLLALAPALGGGAAGAASKLGGSAAGLAAASQAFSKLGLKPELVSKAVPVLTQFVSKSGGANVGSLLAGVLK